jgi:hypothetical protein
MSLPEANFDPLVESHYDTTEAWQVEPLTTAQCFGNLLVLDGSSLKKCALNPQEYKFHRI